MGCPSAATSVTLAHNFSGEVLPKCCLGYVIFGSQCTDGDFALTLCTQSKMKEAKQCTQTLKHTTLHIYTNQNTDDESDDTLLWPAPYHLQTTGSALGHDVTAPDNGLSHCIQALALPS